MTEPCPGACNTTWRTIPATDPDRPPPVPGEPVWCPRDTARIRFRLISLQTLAALYEHTSDGYGEAPDQPDHANGHPPSPSPGFDTRDEIERMLRGWETEYLRIRGWGTPPIHGHYATVSYEITTFLLRHFTGILESPFAREFGDEVLSAHWQLLDLARAARQYKRGEVPCPVAHCRLMMLFSTDGGDVYWCAACGRPVRRDEYDELCRVGLSRQGTHV
jgi:hypothetical protein